MTAFLRRALAESARRHRPIKTSSSLASSSSSSPFSSTSPLSPLPSPSSSRPGLFGLPGLHSPADWARLADDCIAESDRLVLAAAAAPPTARAVRALDDLSDAVCRVADAAELCRVAAARAEWRAAASAAAARLGAHVYGLNAHAGMASALAAAMKAEEKNRNSGSSTFSREASRVGGALLRDFARSGMFLPTSAARKAASEAEAAAAAASMRFTDALADPEAGGVRFRASWSNNNAPVAATPAAVAAALRFEPDPELRRKCYEAAFSRETTRHLTVPLHEMLEARARRAEALGFGEKGWRGMLIDDDDGGESGGGEGEGGGGLEVSLAGSASTVRSFLLDLAGQLRPLAEEQVSLLSRAKKKARARSEGGGNSRSSDSETRLQPWDVAFFSGRVRGEAAARAAARASGGLLSSASAAPASPQVPVEDAVAGMLDVLEAAVGVRLVRAELRGGEGWAPGGVAKFVAVDVGGGEKTTTTTTTPKIIGGPLSLDRVDPARVLGDVYLDLAPRPAKFPGAAHFTLRCGRNFLLGPSEEEEESGGGGRGGGKASSARPAVAIVASFSGLRETGQEDNKASSHSSSSPSSASSLPWLGSLAWSETTTLLHEGGHALHSLLSRTEFQHLSGTRGPLDVVELPSHVAERWARLPVGCGSGSGRGSASEAAGAAAAALATRGRVSRVDFVAAEAARRATAALDFLGQVTDALVDAELHRGSSNGGGKFSAEAAASDAAALVAALSPLPQASFSSSSSRSSPPLLFSPHARFGHLAGYGGAYYSYVYAECVAADVCARSAAAASGSRRAGRSGGRDSTEEAEELELTRRALRSGGEALRESLLRHGCSAPPREAVRELLARSSSSGGGGGVGVGGGGGGGGGDGGKKAMEAREQQEGSKRERGGWSPDPAARLAEVGVV